MTTKATRVSVVIPCCNLASYLEESLRSVFASTMPPCEALVVDDGSEPPVDGAALEALAEREGWGKRLRLLRQTNQGVAAARNHGIAATEGSYLLPLDADDRIRPSYLEKACGALDQDAGLGVVYSHAQRFGMASDVWEFRPFTLPELLAENRVPACAVFRREVWQQCGGYDPALTTHEDWEFWIRVAAAGWKFHCIPEPLVEYRARADSKVRTWDRPEVRRRHMEYILNKHRSLYAEHVAEVLTLKEMEILRLETLYRQCGEQLVKTADGVRIQEVVIKRLLAEAEAREAELRRLKASPWRRWFRRC